MCILSYLLALLGLILIQYHLSMSSMVMTNHIPRRGVVIWLSVGVVLVSFQAFIICFASRVLLA
jgi:hypothetical protein